MFVNFHIFPAGDHRLDVGQHGRAGRRQIDMRHDKGGKEPGHQRVQRRQERQTRPPSPPPRPLLHAPHQPARDDLQRQQHVEQPEIGHLLQRVEFLLLGLLHRMRAALEDVAQIELGLQDRLVEEAVGPRDELLNGAAGQVIEERHRRVDHEHQRQHVVQPDHVAEVEHAQQVRAMDDQAGEEQQDDRGVCSQCQKRSYASYM
jgi:hypothetical protein